MTFWSSKDNLKPTAEEHDPHQKSTEKISFDVETQKFVDSKG